MVRETETTTSSTWLLFCQPVPAPRKPLRTGFNVYPTPNTTIEELKDLVNARMWTPQPSGIDLELFKPSKPVSATEELFDTLRLINDLDYPSVKSDELATEDGERLMTGRKVSSYWEREPSKLYISILILPPRESEDDPVEAPFEEEQAKVEKLGPHSSSDSAKAQSKRLETFDSYWDHRPLKENETNLYMQKAYSLYQTLWGRGQDAWKEISWPVEYHISETEKHTVTAVDLTSCLGWDSQVEDSFSCHRFIVRKEYLELDQHLSHLEEKDSKRSVLLLGEPGTGRTTYLTWILLNRIISGQPTIYSITPKYCFLFVDAGAHWIPNHSFYLSGDPALINADPLLVLFDINDHQSKPREFGCRRMLVTSSPHSTRHKLWKWYQNPWECTMKSWSWPEICLARMVRPIEGPDPQMVAARNEFDESANKGLYNSSEPSRCR